MPRKKKLQKYKPRETKKIGLLNKVFEEFKKKQKNNEKEKSN